MSKYVRGGASRALPDPAVEPTIRAARVAEILDISARAVLYAVERGEIPAVRVGRTVRILTARWLAESGLVDASGKPVTGWSPLAVVPTPDTTDRHTSACRPRAPGRTA